MEEILDCASCHKDYPTDGRRIHELLCPSIISAGSPPADNNYILGILFRQDSPSAEAVWVKCTKSADDETSISFQNVDVAPFFHGDTAPDAIYTERNPRRNRDTASMLEIWTLPSGEPRPQDTNQTILAAADGLELHHKWAGPVLALAMTRATGFMVDPGQYKNISVEDGADALDFLVDYGNPDHGARLRAALDSLGTQPESNARVVTSVESEDEKDAEQRVFEM